jgi:hypothetical protein
MINTWTALVFAAVCWTIAELSLRSVARLPVEAACRRCRHDLRGSVELRCPECGAMAEGRDRGYWRRRRLSRRGVATLAFVLGLLSLIGPLMSVMPLRVELRSSIAVGNSGIIASAYMSGWYWSEDPPRAGGVLLAPQKLELIYEDKAVLFVRGRGEWVDPHSRQSVSAAATAGELGCGQCEELLKEVLALDWSSSGAHRAQSARPQPLTPGPLEVRDTSSAVMHWALLGGVGIAAIWLAVRAIRAEREHA